MKKRVLPVAYLAVILCLLYLPIILIVVFSFSGNSSFKFTDGFTLSSYASMFSSEKLLNALKHTLLIAAVSSVLSTIIGTFAAVGIFYLPSKVKKPTLSVNQLPMVNSEIVMAVSLMVFFVTFRFPQGYLRLILGHIAFCTPYVVLSVMPRLYRMNPNLYEAALDLGANQVGALAKVVFPYLFPGVVSGFMMSFTLSMDDFIITQINKGQTGIETLSTLIYEDARVQGLESFWFAVFSIIFALVLFAVLYAEFRKNKLSQKG